MSFIGSSTYNTMRMTYFNNFKNNFTVTKMPMRSYIVITKKRITLAAVCLKKLNTFIAILRLQNWKLMCSKASPATCNCHLQHFSLPPFFTLSILPRLGFQPEFRYFIHSRVQLEVIKLQFILKLKQLNVGMSML